MHAALTWPVLAASLAAQEGAGDGARLLPRGLEYLLLAACFVGLLVVVRPGLGRAFSGFLNEAGFRAELMFRIVARMTTIPKRRVWIAEHLYKAGVQVLHVVLLVGLFMGMIVSLQTGIELSRIGQQDQIGTIVAISMAREMGPFITAIILAATYGSSIAAEIGTMSVSDELAALEVLSVDRISFLVVPRTVALTIICPALAILCDTIGILGGAFVAQSQLNVGFTLYMDTAIEALRGPSFGFIALPKDVYAGLAKAAVFGFLVSVISAACGLKARGGALGVGNATRQAVRDSIIVIIVSNYFMTWFLYQNA